MLLRRPVGSPHRFLSSALAVLVLGLAACSEQPLDPDPDPDPDPTGPRPAAVVLDLTAVTISPQESLQVGAEVRDSTGAALAGATLRWESSDEAVATVDASGKVLAKSPGAAIVRAIVAGADTVRDSLTLQVVTSYAAIAAGGYWSCGITPEQRLYCWGANGNYQLGLGHAESRLVPAPVAGDLRWQSVSTRIAHTCGVTVTNDGYCWGHNGVGYVGDGTWEPRPSPTPVAGGHKWTSITTGRETSCGITTAGDAYCWGRGSLGRLGTGSETATATPAPVVGGHKFQKIVLGLAVGCGLTVSGDAYCWGSGALGTGQVPSETHTPVAVAGGHRFVDIAAAFDTVCGLTAAGETWCWGQNYMGLLGEGAPHAPTPVRVAPEVRFSSIVASPEHMCGLEAATGRAFCWGRNAVSLVGADGGKLGYETAGEYSATPRPVLGDRAFVQLSAGEDHTCGVTAGGAAYCWGANDFGQLGDGGTEGGPTPRRVLHPGA